MTNANPHSRENSNPSMHTITDHLDLWASAETPKKAGGRGRGAKNRKSPHGIKKLRELILELAVRGKLVPQDASDEPASKLLKKIAAEKTRLIKEGKIKKKKSQPSISKDEVPFQLPEGWSWHRLGDLCVLENGDRSKNYPNKSLLVDSGIPFVNAGHLQNGRINKDEMSYISEERYDILKAGKFSDGDILFCLRGSLGKSAIVEGFDRGAIASSLVIIKLFTHLNTFFIHNYFDSPFSFRMIKLYDNGTAQPNLSAADLAKFLIPLPSFSEQCKIVAKVDELMALCDVLEQEQTDSSAAHQTLVETLLGTLTQAKDNHDFQAAWSRIAEHFDTLFSTEKSIDQLKQSILQLAVMGKLVPQDPSDEPASELLKKIAIEKSKLIKEGKIKKQKLLAPVGEDEKSFELLVGWKWCKLGRLSLRSEAGWSPRCEPTPRDGNNWGVLKVSAVTWGKFNPNENKELPITLKPRPEYEVKPNDFLISRANTAELVAKAVIVPIDVPTCLMMSDKIIRFVFSENIFGDYVSLFNNSLLARSYYDRVAGGTSSSMKNVSREQIRNLVIPLPPLTEQHRIVQSR